MLRQRALNPDKKKGEDAIENPIESKKPRWGKYDPIDSADEDDEESEDEDYETD